MLRTFTYILRISICRLEGFTRIICENDILVTTLDYQSWDGEVEENIEICVKNGYHHFDDEHEQWVNRNFGRFLEFWQKI